MKNNAPNDWFLAVVENPTMNLSDFETVGLNTENTALKDKEFYKFSVFCINPRKKRKLSL